MGKKSNGLMTVGSTLDQYMINYNNNDDARTSRADNIALDILLPVQHKNSEAQQQNGETCVSSMESSKMAADNYLNELKKIVI